MSASSTSTAGTDGRVTAQLPRYFRWLTERCVLRQLDGADVPRIWRAVVQPVFAQCWSDAAPRSEREVKEMARHGLADWVKGNGYSMAVVKRQSQEFVGCLGVDSTDPTRTIWNIRWFIHPNFLGTPIAVEAIMAIVDLTFAALDAHKLYAACPGSHDAFEQMLNDAGFIELIPAGSLDQYTHKPRTSSLFEMRREDWMAIRREYNHQTGSLSLAPIGTGVTNRPTLELL